MSQPWGDVRRDIDAAVAAVELTLVVGWPTERREHLERFVTDVLPTYADHR